MKYDNIFVIIRGGSPLLPSNDNRQKGSRVTPLFAKGQRPLPPKQRLPPKGFAKGHPLHAQTLIPERSFNDEKNC